MSGDIDRQRRSGPAGPDPVGRPRIPYVRPTLTELSVRETATSTTFFTTEGFFTAEEGGDPEPVGPVEPS
jgi:hypothetical protein